MFTLLIADDEPLAQVGLNSMLDWEALDVSIIGSSPNGAHALEAIKRLVPDIVIVDVRMPIIDGITLIERCREEMETPPEFIVLSGHADFDYARRAIRSGVVDYLVKLELDEALLRGSVEKAIAAVKAKRGDLVRPPIAAPADEADFVAFLSRSAGPYAEAEVPSELSGQFPAGVLHCVAVFRIVYRHDRRLSDEERERTYRCVLDTMKHVAGREVAVRAVPLDIASFALVLSPASEDRDESYVEEASYAAVERAREPAERYFGVALHAGIGRAVGLSLLPESYRDALHAVAGADAAHPIVRRCVPRVARNFADSPALRRARSELELALESRSAELLRRSMDAAIAEFEQDHPSPSEMLAACCDLLYAMLAHLAEAGPLLDSLFPEEAEGYRWLFAAGRTEQILHWLRVVRDGLSARFESEGARRRNPLVTGVREYVEAHWAEKLALSDVAAHFKISPNHLSSIFKKYSGTGFVEFVSEVKMGKAKELISGGRYKMYEVAQLLGYEDAYYFSKVFKKVTGMSPREYHLRFAVAASGSPEIDLQSGS